MKPKIKTIGFPNQFKYYVGVHDSWKDFARAVDAEPVDKEISLEEAVTKAESVGNAFCTNTLLKLGRAIALSDIADALIIPITPRTNVTMCTGDAYSPRLIKSHLESRVQVYTPILDVYDEPQFRGELESLAYEICGNREKSREAAKKVMMATHMQRYYKPTWEEIRDPKRVNIMMIGFAPRILDYHLQNEYADFLVSMGVNILSPIYFSDRSKSFTEPMREGITKFMKEEAICKSIDKGVESGYVDGILFVRDQNCNNKKHTFPMFIDYVRRNHPNVKMHEIVFSSTKSAQEITRLETFTELCGYGKGGLDGTA